MLIKHKYKSIIGAFLLALYTFIAMPTQLWHQHGNIAKKSTAQSSNTLQQGDTDYVVAFDTDADSEECKLCAHHYSHYTNDAIIAIVPSLSFNTTVQNNLSTSFSCASLFETTGRGPPALV